jgi:transposase
MADAQDLGTATREQLLAIIAQQRAIITELQATVTALRAELAEVKRRQQRQAAPFSTGERVSRPKPPGRRPGEGTFEYRRAPAAEAVTGPPVEVPVTTGACPRCGGELDAPTVESAWVTDLPEAPQPQVTEYRVAVCRCRRCGRVVRGSHPELAADQYGATSHRLGWRLRATAHLLHYGLGVPQRKVPAILGAVAGVQVTQSALAQDAQRRTAGEVGAAYQELRTELREAPAVHTDDTGWRVSGETAYLMVFRSLRTTVYQIRGRHRNEEVREVVPSDYDGVLCTDRGRSYDAKELAEVKQQKCLSHIQRSLRAVLVTKYGRGRSFTKQLKALLTEALVLWRQQRAGAVPDYADRVRELEARLTRHLRDRPLPDRDNQRLLDDLGWHHEQGNLVRFLHDPQVEPTNNTAERALRPAVIARKVSQCSKNERGAESFAAFASLCQTLRQRGVGIVDGLTALFQSGHLPTADSVK